MSFPSLCAFEYGMRGWVAPESDSDVWESGTFHFHLCIDQDAYDTMGAKTQDIQAR